MLDTLCELELNHMKYQVLFSLKNNRIKFRMLSATNLLSAFRVNVEHKLFVYVHVFWRICQIELYMYMHFEISVK